MDEREYAYLKHKIRQSLNIDIDAYKSQQMRRRLETYVSSHGSGNVTQFCKSLDADAKALGELRDVLTINVSEFFRDSSQFEHLRSVILPKLLQPAGRINIWSAGCSHGEEPYSVAITLVEMDAAYRSRILATDLDREALKRAKEGGPYRSAEVRNVPQRQLRKYFTPCGDGYVVTDQIRKRVEFREHNLVADEFENGWDLVICRNVMIYFSGEVKSNLFRRLRDCLKPGGVLFIGGAEAMLGNDAVGFERLSGNFYRKSGVPLLVGARDRRFA